MVIGHLASVWWLQIAYSDRILNSPLSVLFISDFLKFAINSMADPTMMKINKLYVDRIVVYVRVSFRPFAKCNCCELHMRHGTRPHGHMHTWYRCFTTEIITVKKIHLTCIIIRLNACGIWFNGCSIREACAHTHVCNIHADGVRNMWFTAECFANLWSLFVLPIFSHGRKWAADCYSELKWVEKLKNKITELCSNHATNRMGRWNGKKMGVQVALCITQAHAQWTSTHCCGYRN